MPSVSHFFPMVEGLPITNCMFENKAAEIMSLKYVLKKEFLINVLYNLDNIHAKIDKPHILRGTECVINSKDIHSSNFIIKNYLS